MSFEAIPFPPAAASADVKALYAHCATLTKQLRKVLQTQVGADLTALLAQMTAMQADLDALQTDLDGLSTSVAGNLLTDQQKFEIGLTTRVREFLGAPAQTSYDITTQQQRDAQAAMQAAVTAYKRQTGIYQAQTVINTDTERLASDIKLLQADLGSTASLVTNVQTAMADGDNALALSIDSVSTQVASNQAEALLLAQSVDGVRSQIGFQVNSQGQAIGTIRLDGTNATSTITFVADRVLFAHPSQPGTTKNIMSIGVLNGISTIGIDGNIVLDGTIYAQSIAAAQIAAYHIQAGTITADRIATGTITANELASNSITTAKIAANQVTAAKIAVGTITANEIAASTITGSKIAASTITASNLNVTSLSAITANLGTVTAGLIQNPAGTLVFDLANLRLYRTDGTMEINFATKLFKMSG